jgi:glutaredoxin 3
MNIVMYTRKNPVCTFCESAKKLLTEKQIPFTEYVIPEDVDRDSVKEAYPDAKTVPVVVIDGKWIGGFTELQQVIGGN